MAININCPKCNKPHKLKDELAGKKIKCVECQEAFVVPNYANVQGNNISPYPPPFAPGVGYVPFEEKKIGEDAGMRVLLPVGRSVWAILAGYFGLFSMLVVPAPFAIIFGFIAINDIKNNPDKHGLGRAYFGIIAGILAIVIFLIFMMNK